MLIFVLHTQGFWFHPNRCFYTSHMICIALNQSVSEHVCPMFI